MEHCELHKNREGTEEMHEERWDPQRTEKLLLIDGSGGGDSWRRQPSTWFLKADMVWGKGFPKVRDEHELNYESGKYRIYAGGPAAQMGKGTLWRGERRQI